MKRCLLALLFGVSTLYAAPDTDSAALSSSNAVYDGNALVLTGHVLLDHGLGKMAADEAKLQKQEAGKDFPFSLIQLINNVQLTMKNGAQIHCDGADLDFTSLKGLLSAQDGGKVVYSDNLKKGLFRLLGNSVELKISKQATDQKKTDFEIETILAKDDVNIEFAKGFSLQAHQALYRKSPLKENSSEEFQGAVTAYPKDADTPCRLTHGEDLIDAESVDLDLIHSKLALLHPKGMLTSRLMPGMQKGELKFTCDHLLWDHLKNTLTLKGHVHVLESVVGKLTSEGELEIVHTQQKQGKMLKSISTIGTTSMHFKDENGTPHHLKTHGPFLFDRKPLRATFESPKKKGGSVSPDRQIYYETEGLSLYANQALIEYTATQGHLKPTALSLSGNIRLFAADEKKPRFAMADRLSVSTTTRTLILAANSGKKVLFVDESQSLRIAAQEIHITRDAKTGEERVQGVGSVQFALTDEENGLLKKVFPNYKTPV